MLASLLSIVGLIPHAPRAKCFETLDVCTSTAVPKQSECPSSCVEGRVACGISLCVLDFVDFAALLCHDWFMKYRRSWSEEAASYCKKGGPTFREVASPRKLMQALQEGPVFFLRSD